MNRGAAKAAVFVKDADGGSFLALLGELEGRFGVEVHGYCLMENHYHLLLRTRAPNLSRAMRHLDGVFTQRAHRRRGTDGPIFRGRFKSVLVQADGHLLTAIRYIHLNPSEAGLVNWPEDWEWSSHRAYLDPSRAPHWLRTEAILDLFGPPHARERYRAFVSARLDPDGERFYARPKWQPILGDEAFIERIRRTVDRLGDTARQEMPETRSSQLRIPLDRIAAEASAAFGIDMGSLLVTRGRRISRDTDHARGTFIHVAHRLGGWRMAEITSWLGYRTNAGTYHAARRFDVALSSDSDLRTRLGSSLRMLAFEQDPSNGRPDPSGLANPEIAESGDSAT